MPLHALLSTWGGTSIGPLWLWKSWKEILLVIIAVLATGWLISNRAARQIILSDRLAQLVLAYVGLGLVLTALNVSSLGIDAASAGLASGLRYMVIASVGFILFRFAKWNWPVVSKKVLIFLVGIGVVMGVLGLLQVTVLPRDLLTNFGYEKGVTIAPFMVIDENQNAPRAFATLRGPNEFGAFLILPLVASLLFVKRRVWKIVVVAAIGLGVALSVSRSAWIGAVLAVGALATLTYGSSILRSKRFIYGGMVGLVVVVLLVLSALSVPALRLAIFRSSPGDTSLTEGSTDQHWLATTGGLVRVVHNPLGCGFGCAGPASYYGDSPKISENYYVQIAEEIGIIGLALWASIVFLIAKRLYAAREDLLARTLLASLVGLSAIGFWLHVWSDDPLALTWWGLAGAVIGYYASASRKKTVS